MWICIGSTYKNGARQLLLQFCYFFFQNGNRKVSIKTHFLYSEGPQVVFFFFAERVTEQSRAPCSCGFQMAAPLLNGAEQPWEFSAPIRSSNCSNPLLTAPILDPPHLCVIPNAWIIFFFFHAHLFHLAYSVWHVISGSACPKVFSCPRLVGLTHSLLDRQAHFRIRQTPRRKIAFWL